MPVGYVQIVVGVTGSLLLDEFEYTMSIATMRRFAQNSRAHHYAYLRKRALEAARRASFEETSTDQIPKPSPAPIPNDAIPSALASELEQPISHDSLAAQVLDLNEHAQEQPQE
ncbi:hypothetical protein JHK85_012647 [Glycine max]|nr:hypothetical protein JHK85_012647 [Glycine max]